MQNIKTTTTEKRAVWRKKNRKAIETELMCDVVVRKVIKSISSNYTRKPFTTYYFVYGKKEWGIIRPWGKRGRMEMKQCGCGILDSGKNGMEERR